MCFQKAPIGTPCSPNNASSYRKTISIQPVARPNATSGSYDTRLLVSSKEQFFEYPLRSSNANKGICPSTPARVFSFQRTLQWKLAGFAAVRCLGDKHALSTYFIPETSSSTRASRIIGSRRLWSRGRLCRSCDATSASTVL